MTEIEARAELALLVDASSDPALSDADLDLCLRKARRVDAAGLLVSDPNWAPTFSMHAAAAAAWGLKAARAASRTDFSTMDRGRVPEFAKIQTCSVPPNLPSPNRPSP